MLVDENRPDVAPVAPTLLPRMALAVLLGLLVGLAVAVLLEMLRPRLPGARAVARRFDAPILGSTNQRLSAQINAMTLGARRQGLETVVILGVDPDSQRTAAWLLRSIERPGPAHSPAAKTRAPSYAATSEPDAYALTGGGDEPELAPLPTTVRFTDLASVSAAQEMTAGVVVVTSRGSPPERRGHRRGPPPHHQVAGRGRPGRGTRERVGAAVTGDLTFVSAGQRATLTGGSPGLRRHLATALGDPAHTASSPNVLLDLLPGSAPFDLPSDTTGDPGGHGRRRRGCRSGQCRRVGPLTALDHREPPGAGRR